MPIRDSVQVANAYLDSVGAPVKRHPLTTADAVLLAKELGANALRFPAKVGAAVAAWDRANATAQPTQRVALTRYLKDLENIETHFWDAFHGEVVDGIVIIRRNEA